jgi:hypothetical protein
MTLDTTVGVGVQAVILDIGAKHVILDIGAKHMCRPRFHNTAAERIQVTPPAA